MDLGVNGISEDLCDFIVLELYIAICINSDSLTTCVWI